LTMVWKAFVMRLVSKTTERDTKGTISFASRCKGRETTVLWG
jgi:hypothetical protein